MSMIPYEKELLESINEVKLDVRELKVTVEKTLNKDIENHDRRISSLESNQRWVVFAVIGSVLTALLNIVLK